MVETGRDLDKVSSKLVSKTQIAESSSKDWYMEFKNLLQTLYSLTFFMSWNLLLWSVLSFKTSSVVDSSRRLSGTNGFDDWDMVM